MANEKVISDGVQRGTASLFDAITSLDPGLQIAFIVLLGTTLASLAAAAWVSKQLIEEWKLSRQETKAIKAALESTNVAIALLGERLK